jgi:plastocyanin
VIAALLAAAAAVTPVGVGADEFSLALYRTRVKPGAVRLNMQNLGEDPHDLAIAGPLPRRTLRGITPENIRPGANGSLKVTLRAQGRYVVYCSLPLHERRGMKAVLTVSRKPAAKRR